MLTIGKTGTGTWVLSGNNTFTGGFLVSGGTIQYANATTTALTGALTFTADTTAANGWTGWQAAGGTFQYNAGGGSLTLGALTPTAGAGNVTISAGTALTFGSLGTRAAGATINLTPGAGAIKFTAAVTGTNSIIGGFATINGTDFAGSVAATGSVAAVATTTLPATVGSGTVNYLSAGSTATTGAIAANSLKVSTAGTVSGTGVLTITSATATSLGGILFDNSGGAGSISGFTGIAPSVTANELIIYTGGTTPANALTVSSPISATGLIASNLTKAGTGTLILSGNSTLFTGNTVINEGTLQLSGATANLLGTGAGSTFVRQLGTLDINGAGVTAVPYTSATSLPTVYLGGLTGGGSTSPVVQAQTTTTASATNSTTISVSSVSGIALGQTVLGLTAVNGSPNSGTAVVTGISGTTITLSNPLTLASGANLNFVANVTSGATVTNSGSTAVAISIGGASASGIYTGVIQNGARR